MMPIDVGAAKAPAPSIPAGPAFAARQHEPHDGGNLPFAQLVTDFADDPAITRREPQVSRPQRRNDRPEPFSRQTSWREREETEAASTHRSRRRQGDDEPVGQTRPKNSDDRDPDAAVAMDGVAANGSQPARDTGRAPADKGTAPVTGGAGAVGDSTAEAVAETAAAGDAEATGSATAVSTASGAPAVPAAQAAASNAAAALRAATDARKVALDAVKQALASQAAAADEDSVGADDSVATAIEQSAGDDAAAATGPKQASAHQGKGAVANALASAIEAGAQVAGAEEGGGSGAAHDGGKREHGGTAPGEAPPPARFTGHASQAIAAFQAAAAAAEAPLQMTAGQAAETSLREALADPELPASIVHSIHLQAMRGGGEARLTLNPGFLGEMTVGVRVDGSSVSASLHASSGEVRDWIRANEAALRQALADQGFNLERLVVHDEEPPHGSGGGSRQQREAADQQPPRRQPRQAPAGSFEALI
jgi:hypothetical protein